MRLDNFQRDSESAHLHWSTVRDDTDARSVKSLAASDDASSSSKQARELASVCFTSVLPLRVAREAEYPAHRFSGVILCNLGNLFRIHVRRSNPVHDSCVPTH